MKKLFIFPFLLMAGSLYAQDNASNTKAGTTKVDGYLYSKSANPGVRFGLRGGFSIARFSPSKGTYGTSSANTGNATLYAEIPVQRNIYIQAGVSYVKAGGTYIVRGAENINNTIISSNVDYLQIPVTAVGKMAIGKKSNVFAGAGGYFGLAFGGNLGRSAQMTDGSTFKESRDINFETTNSSGFGDPGDMKKTDAGLQGMVGVEFNNVTISGHISQGLVNVRRADDGSSLKNQVISINFGFLF